MRLRVTGIAARPRVAHHDVRQRGKLLIYLPRPVAKYAGARAAGWHHGDYLFGGAVAFIHEHKLMVYARPKRFYRA
jgi:hypothetical protein